MIDLRSDALVPLTAAARSALAAAESGDDFYGECPVTTELEHEVAELLGKEAAVFMPTGTMANTLAVLVLCPHRDRLLMDSRCHIRLREMGPLSLLADLRPAYTDSADGCPDPAATARWLGGLARNPAQPPLVCVENTHIFRGGRIIRPERMAALRAALAGSGSRLHLDGSRLFHAAAGLNVSARRLAEGADSVTISLVKGLGIPSGAMLAGARDLVRRAREMRTAVGGTMRQIGWIAAAALVALRDGFDHLQDDHRRAQALAQVCRECGLGPEPAEVDSNVVLFDSTRLGLTGAEFAALALDRGMKVALLGPTTVRFATSGKVSDRDVQRAGEILREIVAERRVSA